MIWIFFLSKKSFNYRCSWFVVHDPNANECTYEFSIVNICQNLGYTICTQLSQYASYLCGWKMDKLEYKNYIKLMRFFVFLIMIFMLDKNINLKITYSFINRWSSAQWARKRSVSSGVIGSSFNIWCTGNIARWP